MSDKYRTQVELYVQFTGTNGQTTFSDVGPDARTVTRNGNLQVTTAQNPFGMSNGSGLFDGTGDFASIATSADFSLANTTPFCIEMFFRATTIGGQTLTLTNKRQSTGAQEHSMTIDTTGALRFSLFDSSPVLTLASSAGAISQSVWYYAAAIRDGSNLSRLVIGQPGGLASVVASGTQSGLPATSTEALRIGRDGFMTNRDFIGNISHYRFTKGTQRYFRFPYAVPCGPFSLGKRVGVTGQGRSPIIVAA